jgi:hypothetical protein
MNKKNFMLERNKYELAVAAIWILKKDCAFALNYTI